MLISKGHGSGYKRILTVVGTVIWQIEGWDISGIKRGYVQTNAGREIWAINQGIKNFKKEEKVMNTSSFLK